MTARCWFWRLAAVLLIAAPPAAAQQSAQVVVPELARYQDMMGSLRDAVKARYRADFELEMETLPAADDVAHRLFSGAAGLAVVTAASVHVPRLPSARPPAARYLARIDTVTALLVARKGVDVLLRSEPVRIAVWPRAFGHGIAAVIAESLSLDWRQSEWSDDDPLRDAEAVLVIGSLPDVLARGVVDGRAGIVPLVEPALHARFRPGVAAHSAYPNAITAGTLIPSIEVDVVLATDGHLPPSALQSLQYMLLVLFGLQSMPHDLWSNASPCASVAGWQRHDEVRHLQAHSGAAQCKPLVVPWQ